MRTLISTALLLTFLSGLTYSQTLKVEPDTLDFGRNETSKKFGITNIGANTLSWSIADTSVSGSPRDTWIISVSTETGTATTEVDSAEVTVNRNNLAPGAYSDTLVVNSNGGTDSVIVKMEVKAELDVQPAILDFGRTATSKKFGISNGGSGILSWTIADTSVSGSPLEDWIDINPKTDSTTTKPDSVTVTINRANLAPGSYSDTLVVNSNGGTDSVKVTMSVNRPPTRDKETPDFFLTVGGLDSMLTLGDFFSDPDSDPLKFLNVADTSKPQIAAITISEDSQKLKVSLVDPAPVKRDTAVIVVVVQDTFGAVVADTFKVIVNYPPKIRMPNPIRMDTLTVSPMAKYTLNLGDVFVDPDNDSLTFPSPLWSTNTTSDDSGKILVKIDDDMDRFLIVEFDTSKIDSSEGIMAQALDITVKAADGHGGEKNTTFSLIINDPPYLTGNTFDDLNIKIGSEPNIRIFIDITEEPRKFADPDEEDELEFGATPDTNLVVVEVDDNMLKIIPQPDTSRRETSVQITVTAKDFRDSKPRGGEKSTSFDLRISRNKDAVIELLEPAQSRLVQGDLSVIDEKTVLNLRMKVTDEEKISGLPELSYRKGGDLSTIRIPLRTTSEKDEYAAVIPADSVTSKGVEFSIMVLDREGFSTRKPKKGVFSVRVNVPAGVEKSRPQPGGNAQTAYRLISLPLDLAEKSINSWAVNTGLPFPYDKTRWRLFEPKPNVPSDSFREFPDIQSTTVDSGKAFWLIVKKPDIKIKTGPGTSHRTDQPFAIPLLRGWNYFGNPFNFATFANVTLSNDNSTNDTLGAIFTFDGSWSFPNEPENVLLQPFEGYVIYSDKTDTLLVNPDKSSTSVSQAKGRVTSAFELADWSIQILAKCQEARDINNLAAIAAGTSPNWDRRDYPEPPVIGEYVSVYFPHPEWQRSMKKFTTDFRPPTEDGYTWEFEIKSNIRDKVDLAFEGVANVPAEFGVWLVDEAVQISRNLREQNQYSVAGRGPDHPKRLKLVVGRSDFVAERLQGTLAIPRTYELSQNFPNPFNPSTTIRYGLPQDDRVTLKIYNVLGREVATLLNDVQKTAGFHAVVWNGRDNSDRPVASGIYIYQIRTETFAKVRKMVLVK